MTAPRDAAVPTARAQRPAAVAYVLKGAGKPEADAEAEPDWQARSARTRWNPGRSPRRWQTAPRLACGAPSVTNEKLQALDP